MAIFDLLSKQCREIEELFGDVQNAVISDQMELAEVTFQLLSVKLITAMRAEHATVYPRIADATGLVHEVLVAVKQHDEIEQAINNVRLGALAQDAWCDGIAHLGKLVADHADYEEQTLFPVARLSLSNLQQRRIAADYMCFQPVAASVASVSITYDPEPPQQVYCHVRPRAA